MRIWEGQMNEGGGRGNRGGEEALIIPLSGPGGQCPTVVASN